MELYPLNASFQRQDLLEEFHSVIWTERFNSPGEVQLTVPANPANISQLAEGTFLATPGTDEVMLLETQSIENGLLTVSGTTLLDFLNHRIIRASAHHLETNWILYETTPGTAMAQIVQEMCIAGVISDGAIGGHAAYELIPNLITGDVAIGGDMVGNRVIAYGSVYEELKKIADSYSLGMSLYLAYADLSGYQLVFKSWDGIDRTRTGGNEVVAFSPAMDTLADLKELRSVKGYKNVCYAFNTAEEVLVVDGYFGLAYAEPSAATKTGFQRRSMMIFDNDFKSTDFETVVITIGDIVAVLNEKARDALANNNYTKVVDGEVVPQPDAQYGVHYGLGDIVELQSNSGAYQPARITEYIRTHDSSGEKAYPTVTVLE